MSSPPTDLLIVMGANLLKKKYPGLVQPNLKLADFLKIFKSFFHTAWRAYMNICLCSGCADTCWLTYTPNRDAGQKNCI